MGQRFSAAQQALMLGTTALIAKIVAFSQRYLVGAQASKVLDLGGYDGCYSGGAPAHW
jgi:hypothetical protein